MNHLNDPATREYAAGIVECRICGLKFLPNLEEDRDLHEQKHRQIICGGLPYEIREFIKRAAWDILRDKRPPQTEHDKREQEIATRAIAFAWWARAISKGIPENDFEPFMAAHLAYIDASVSGDEEQLDEAEEVISRWYKYG